jgi:hypothetical protein
MARSGYPAAAASHIDLQGTVNNADYFRQFPSGITFG